jgi:hypothetical protein
MSGQLEVLRGLARVVCFVADAIADNNTKADAWLVRFVGMPQCVPVFSEYIGLSDVSLARSGAPEWQREVLSVAGSYDSLKVVTAQRLRDAKLPESTAGECSNKLTEFFSDASRRQAALNKYEVKGSIFPFHRAFCTFL